MPKLKPCPFCGGTDELGIAHYELDQSLIYVLCGDCQCEGPVGFSEKEAIEAWNRRVEDG